MALGQLAIWPSDHLTIRPSDLSISQGEENSSSLASLFPFSLIVFPPVLLPMPASPFRVAINFLSRHCNNSNSNGKDIRIYHLYGLTAKNALRRCKLGGSTGEAEWNCSMAHQIHKVKQCCMLY